MKIIILGSAILISLITTTSFAQRKVLIEQFTNSGCPPCASNTPVVASYVNDNLDHVLMLSYHTSFPYLDSMYHENAAQSDARVDYYNVQGVPTSVVDGNYFSGSLLPAPETIVDPRAAIAPRYSISFISSSLTGNDVTAQIVFQSIDAVNENETLKAMVVVAEKNVLKSSYASSPGNNSETEYPWVVRKMLPDENGTALVNMELNGTDTITLSWTADNFKDLNEMRIVAFVQNASTQEIYQSEISAPSNATGLNEIAAAYSTFSLFPSITKDDFTIELNQQNNAMQLRIFNLLGNEIFSLPLENKTLQTIHSGIKESGIYFVQVGNESGAETKKIIFNR